MVKETNAPVRKKRKSTVADSDPEPDIYQKICEFEEKEAKSRDVVADSKLFAKCIESIHDQLHQVRELKNSQKAQPAKQHNLSANLAEIAVKICLIKKLNRIDKLYQVAERQQLILEKQKCDSVKLTYQNLVYELYHLTTETNKCLAFKSEDENIELVSFEDFMKNAPPSITSKFKNYDPLNHEEAHALKLARLEWELTQRKNVAEECKSLEERKKTVVAEITERKEKLNDLLPLLNVVIKAAKPLQEHLGMSGDHTRKEHCLANLLPDPLYILYANIVAYKSVFETNLTVSIVGDKDDATQFNEAQEVANCLNEDDSEPESELPEVEEVVEVKKRRHRKSAQQVDPLEEKKKRLLEVHPLKIELSFAIDEGPKLSLNFSYYTKLKLVTVNANVDVPSKITANTAGEILAGHNILSELVENDTGMESPNPSTGYLLKKMNLGLFQILVPDIGYAYGWAQSVCGINFLSPKKYCDKLSQQNVEMILKVIRKRLINRTHLAKQMQQLEQNILPPVPEDVETPTTRISTIGQWSSTTFQNFCQARFTQPLIDEEFVTVSDLFYSVKIIRGEANLKAFVVIKNTYPLPPPIFVLDLNYKGHHNSSNCDEIRDIERTLNVNWDHGMKSSAWLLSAQLQHLCSYLDVYLETLDPKTFQPNAKFIQNISGKNRRRPFKFRKIGTTGLFSQY
uniref:THO complex subunit 5 homolog n=1 Tax=Dendroctonus ponderosae TaxID=77166 RepID=A0AAR5Q0U7_DENPD